MNKVNPVSTCQTQASLYDRDNYIERKLKINYKTQFLTNMMLKDEKKKNSLKK